MICSCDIISRRSGFPLALYSVPVMWHIFWREAQKETHLKQTLLDLHNKRLVNVSNCSQIEDEGERSFFKNTEVNCEQVVRYNSLDTRWELSSESMAAPSHEHLSPSCYCGVIDALCVWTFGLMSGHEAWIWDCFGFEITPWSCAIYCILVCVCVASNLTKFAKTYAFSTQNLNFVASGFLS